MDRVPQSNQLNPAFQPKCNFYLGLPNVQYNFRNTFSINDLLPYNSQIDSLLTPLSPLTNVDRFLTKLTDHNSLYNSLQVEALSLGFRIKDLYFTLGISAKMDASLKYPTDLIRLGLTAQFDRNSNYDFRNLGLDATAYGELALGVSKNYNDEFTLGVRAKLLTGLMNITTSNKKFNLFSTMEDSLPKVNIRSDLSILASTAYFLIDTNSSGQITNIEMRKNANKYYKPFQSPGVGLDLGISYTGIDQFILSASLLDLGFIKWRNDEYRFKMNGDTSFLGLQHINIFSKDTALLQKFVDSLENVFKFGQYSTSYTTWLPTKLYLGAEFMPAPFFSLGFLSMTQY
jgi:hypothetical protein